MADAMNEYVAQVVDKKIEDSQCIMAIPATVEKVLSNGMCMVRLIANGTEFVVPNWSGCDVRVGDEIRLFYTGAIVSERTAYIGAAAYMVNRQWSCVNGNFIVDENSQSTPYPKGIRRIINGTTNISRYGFRASHKQTVLLTFNGVIVGGSAATGVTKVESYIDNVKYDFSYAVSIFAAGRKYCPTITLPFVVEAGNHVVEVKITGICDDMGFYSDACSYVVGQGLTEVEVN